MNGRMSKTLRRMAEARTEGQKKVTYKVRWYDKIIMLPGGVPGLRYQVYTATLSGCTRGVYQALKREFKKLKQGGKYVGPQINAG